MSDEGKPSSLEHEVVPTIVRNQDKAVRDTDKDVAEEVETTDEEMGDEEESSMDDQREEALQAVIALNVRNWLAEHGAKLFSLELSKKRVRLEETEVKKVIKAPERKLPLVSPVDNDRPAKRRRVGSRIQ